MFSKALLVTIIAIPTVLLVLLFSLADSMSCVDAHHQIYFIKNRVTQQCQYTYACASDPIREHPSFLYTAGCSESEALAALQKDNKYQESLRQLVRSCDAYCSDPEAPCTYSTQNPTLSCDQILNSGQTVLPYLDRSSDRYREKLASISIAMRGPGTHLEVVINPNYIELTEQMNDGLLQTVQRELQPDEFAELEMLYVSLEVWKYEGRYSDVPADYNGVTVTDEYMFTTAEGSTVSLYCTNGCPAEITEMTQKIQSLVNKYNTL